MLKIRVQDITTGKIVVCDVLRHSRFHMRVVPEGTQTPVDFHRAREHHPFHADSKKVGGLVLETMGEIYGDEFGDEI